MEKATPSPSRASTNKRHDIWDVWLADHGHPVESSSEARTAIAESSAYG
jgi:hypothetical protein